MKKQKGNSGIGFLGLLFIVLMVLKLTSIITWSWWIISAPLWLPALIVMLLLVFVLAR